MIKLYLPYGRLKRFGGNRQVTLHWFVKDRPQPVAPYAELVERYSQLAPEARQRAGRIVDEMFTESEFHALHAYLYDREREDVRTAMMVAPVNGSNLDNRENRGLIRPFGDDPDRREGGEPSHGSGGGGFCRLAQEEGYALPFAVWGYYAAP
jgi:hypothetical protein